MGGELFGVALLQKAQKTLESFQGVKVGMLGRQNERNGSYLGWLTPLYLVCVLCQSA